jgi:TldD protein
MDALPPHEGDLQTALDRVARVAAYADVLAESDGGRSVRVEKGLVQPAVFPRMVGAIFRAWTGERWAEAVAESLEADSLRRAADGLLRELARPVNARQLPPGRDPEGSMEGRTRSAHPMEDDPIESMVEQARSWFDVGMGEAGILNTYVNLASSENERLFLASSGARRHQVVDRVHASVLTLVMENGRVEYDARSKGGTGGREILAAITPEDIRKSAATAHALLRAKEAPQETVNVVLDPSTAGTFAHESFGHGTEADQMMRDRSYLKPLLGEIVGPEMLTLVDDGARPGAWGSIFFDDEGTPARRTVIVDKGRFVEALHDRESASALHRAPTGNARRADFLSRTFVRMTNTLVEPGGMPLDEMIKEARDGVLLERCTSGIEDPLGGQMQLKVKRGRRIEHGELTGWYSSMALSGKVLDFLRSIRGVGTADSFEIDPGFCGKGHTDLLPAGTGGTYLLSRAIVGPA